MMQARRLDLRLRRLWEDAGTMAGMRLLDLGSGAGDVAMTAATLVGPSGSVLGVDANPSTLETARQRAREAGLANVSFVAGDIREDLVREGAFDTVVGRLVLMCLTKPGAVIRRLLRHLRPGGIVAFQESQLQGSSVSYPPSPLYDQMFDWALQAFARSGTSLSAGLGLCQTFLEAGLPTPQMGVHADLIVGPVSPLYTAAAATLRSLLPRIEEHGIGTAEEVDIDTFEQRLRADFASPPKAAIFAIMVNAWVQKP